MAPDESVSIGTLRFHLPAICACCVQGAAGEIAGDAATGGDLGDFCVQDGHDAVLPVVRLEREQALFGPFKSFLGRVVLYIAAHGVCSSSTRKGPPRCTDSWKRNARFTFGVQSNGVGPGTYFSRSLTPSRSSRSSCKVRSMRSRENWSISRSRTMVYSPF